MCKDRRVRRFGCCTASAKTFFLYLIYLFCFFFIMQQLLHFMIIWLWCHVHFALRKKQKTKKKPCRGELLLFEGISTKCDDSVCPLDEWIRLQEVFFFSSSSKCASAFWFFRFWKRLWMNLNFKVQVWRSFFFFTWESFWCDGWLGRPAVGFSGGRVLFAASLCI